MENRLWEERYQSHNKKLCSHDKRIKDLETFEATTRERIDGLINSVEELTKTMKWFMTTLITVFGGFFLYIIKTLI